MNFGKHKKLRRAFRFLLVSFSVLLSFVGFFINPRVAVLSSVLGVGVWSMKMVVRLFRRRAGVGQ